MSNQVSEVHAIGVGAVVVVVAVVIACLITHVVTSNSLPELIEYKTSVVRPPGGFENETIILEKIRFDGRTYVCEVESEVGGVTNWEE